MRILEIITPSRIGGAETHVTMLAKGLAKLGDEVTVFCPSGRPYIKYLQKYGITPVSWRTHGKLDPVSVRRFTRLIKSEQIDIVHTHLSTATLLGGIAAKLTGVPSIATVHGFNTALCYRGVNRLIAVSEAVKSYQVSQGIPAGKIEVIYNGIPLSLYEPEPLCLAKEVCNFDPDVIRVGIIGRLAPEKGQRIALEAWHLVIRDYPNAKLVLVGDGKSMDELMAYAEALGIRNSVEFAGFQAEPQPYIAACDMILVPSLKEGFGLSAIEAMAMERPVIASDAGGLPEVIDDGETGLIVPAGEPGALANAIVKLIRDPELAGGLARSGRQSVIERFDAANQVAALREALKREVEQFGARGAF